MRTLTTGLLLTLLLGLAPGADAKSVELSRSIESGGALRIDLHYGKVRIYAGAPGRVRVSGEIDDELWRATLGYDAGSVELRVRFSPWKSFLLLFRDQPRYSADLVVEVPPDTRLFVVSRDARIEIEGLEGPIGVGTVSSDILVRAEPSRLAVDTVSGDFFFEGRAGNLRAASMSGQLQVRGAIEEIRLETVSGAIEVLEAADLRRVHLRSVTGDIALDGALAANGLGEIATDSGAVTVRCCGATGLDVSASTGTGEVFNGLSDVLAARDDRGVRLEASFDGGGGRLELRTRTGAVRLVRAGDAGSP